MMTIHESIPNSRLPTPDHLEIITIKLCIKVPIIICLVYNPPNSNSSYKHKLLLLIFVKFITQ